MNPTGKWARAVARWQATLPLCDSDRNLGSWLVVCDNGAAVGCRACTPTKRGWSVKLEGQVNKVQKKIIKHASAKSHQWARNELSGHADDSVSDPHCPSEEMFRKVIEERQAGARAVRRSIAGVGTKRKIVRIQYCAAEAMRFLQRETLRQAKCLATHTDSRAKRLTVRFAACGSGLVGSRGLLGHADYVKSAPIQPDKTTQLAMAFQEVLEHFCTEFKGAPGRPDAERFDRPLYDHLRGIHELFNADAEQCIQLVGDDLTNKLGDEISSLLPNTHSCLKDHTHGCQRILSRPWACNQAIKEIIDTIVEHRTSICQRIRNSDIFQARLKENLKNLENAALDLQTAVLNLAHSKVRFDSVVRALMRYITIHKAVLVTARDIAALRRGEEEGRDAERFLGFVSGPDGVRRELLAGLLCDAGSITMKLLRFFDSEGYDVSEVSQQINEWCSAVKHMFVDQRAFHTPGMFAHQALKNVTSGIQTAIVDGMPVSIGLLSGDASVVAHCRNAYAEINTWIVMATAVIRAEFPSWEILQSFTPFNVRKLDRFGGELQTKLQRLALSFNLPQYQLHREYEVALRAAQRVSVDEPHLDNRQIWRKVVHQLGTSLRSGGALESALIRYCTFSGCTTSGVEHNHSKQDVLFTKRRNTGLQLELDEMKIACDLNDDMDMQFLISVAQRLWRHLYSSTRTWVNPRKPSAKRSVKDNTYAALIRRHHAAVKDVSGDAVAVESLQLSAAGCAAEAWSAAHDAELDFNAAKRHINRLDAFASGQLLPHEVRDRDAVDLADNLDRKKNNKRKRLRGAVNKVAKLASKPSIQHGATVYIHSSATSLRIVQYCNLGFMPMVGDPCVASVVVVPEPGNLPLVLSWSLVLSGGVACNPSFLMGTSGTAVEYNASVTTGERRIWVSNPFKTNHPDLYRIFCRVLAMPTATWREVDDVTWVAAVARNSARVRRQQRNMEYLALLADVQSANADDNLYFTALSLTRKLCDIAGVAMGSCGA
jgi:hypothetical protein